MARTRRNHHSIAAYAIILIGGLANGSYATRFKKDVQSMASYTQPVQIAGGVSIQSRLNVALFNKI
jgi:hypothetical protein